MNVRLARAISLGLVGLSGAASFTLVLVTDGALLPSIAPLVVTAVALTIIWSPPRATALVLLFLALGIGSPQDNPMAGLWRSPLHPVGCWLFRNVSQNIPGIPLPFSGLDVLTMLLALAILLRPAAERPRCAMPVRAALAVFAGAIGLLVLEGRLRGGDFEPMYWQIRQLALLPLVAWALSSALDVKRDVRAVVRVCFAAAFLKLALGFYFYFAVARPSGLSPPDITTHSDTVLFCACVGFCLFAWLESPTRRILRWGLLLTPVLLLGIYLNGRRLAYIGLVAVVAIAFVFARRRRSGRLVIRWTLVLVPFAVLYGAVGWGSSASWAAPVASLKSVIAPGQARTEAASSTRYRMIEDYDLARTVRAHPLGTGFGHPYETVVKPPDISVFFALYRYIPHNEVLGLLSVGGPLGFFLLWAVLVVTIFLAARSHGLARGPLERATALGALAVPVLYAIQAFGDMGTQSWVTTWLLACAIAFAGQQAARVGAWTTGRDLRTGGRGANPVQIERPPSPGDAR